MLASSSGGHEWPASAGSPHIVKASNRGEKGACWQKTDNGQSTEPNTLLQDGSSQKKKIHLLAWPTKLPRPVDMSTDLCSRPLQCDMIKGQPRLQRGKVGEEPRPQLERPVKPDRYAKVGFREKVTELLPSVVVH